MGEVADQWANIHQDMLDEFTKRFYLYDDYLQLRLICKQWNFKLPKILNGNKAPWLLLPIGGGAATEEILDSNSLEEKGIYHLTLPDLQDGLIRGSCYGWLIIVSMYEGTIRMLNPLTKVCLDLPPISDLPDCFLFRGHSMITEETILANKFLVSKVVINSDPDDINFMAVILYGASKLAFYKPSNRRWLKLPTGFSPYVQDVIFFQQKIYAIEHDGHLYEFDTMTRADPVVRIFRRSTPFDPVAKDIIQKYLIGTADGTLLMVVRHLINLICEEEERYYKTTKFDVYELKKDSKAWSRISSLGNYILVIGLNASVQMFAGDLLNSKENQIYFIESFVEEQTYYHNIGIFNLEDGSCQDVLSDVNFFCPPVWIVP